MTSFARSFGFGPIAIQGLSRKLVSTKPRVRKSAVGGRGLVVTPLLTACTGFFQLKPPSTELLMDIDDTTAWLSMDPTVNSWTSSDRNP